MRDFWSLDKPITEKHRDIGSRYGEELVDLRPYLVPHPTTVFTTDVLINSWCSRRAGTSQVCQQWRGCNLMPEIESKTPLPFIMALCAELVWGK